MTIVHIGPLQEVMVTLDSVSFTHFLLGKPFKRDSLVWTADTPITRTQLEKQRETFWETAPTFEVYAIMILDMKA